MASAIARDDRHCLPLEGEERQGLTSPVMATSCNHELSSGMNSDAPE